MRLTLSAAAFMLLGTGAIAGPISIIDGDTVRQDGYTYRLVGFNTPELHSQCPSEYAMAVAATRYLQRLLDSAKQAHIREVKCNGWNYGRKCGQLILDGQDVASDMLSTALAEPYDCTLGCPRRKNWCEKRQDRVPTKRRFP